MSLFLTKTKDPPKAECLPFPTGLRVLGAHPWSPPLSSRGETQSSAAEMTMAGPVLGACSRSGTRLDCLVLLTGICAMGVSGCWCPWCKGLLKADVFLERASHAPSVLFSFFPPLFHFTKGVLLASVAQSSIYRLRLFITEL